MLTSSEVERQNLGFLIKTIIVGDAGVGKSSILKRFTQGEFNNNYNATIGLEFESKEVDIPSDNGSESQKITLQIWDTAGQESFRSIVKSFYRNSAAVLLVYDVTEKKSFDRLSDWIKEIRENSHNDVIIILIGNKYDEKDKRTVSDRDVEKLVTEEGLSIHFYTSAKENTQIKESFQYVATEVYKRFIKGKHDITNTNGIRSSSRSLSIDNNKAREMQKEIEQKEQNQPTPNHRYSIKNQNQKLTNSTNKESSLKEQLINNGSAKQKKSCC